MFALLLRILTLGVASAMSPVLLAVAVSLLSGKDSPKQKTAALLLGTIVTVLILVFIGVNVGHEVAKEDQTPGGLSTPADFVLGVIFIVFGFLTLRHKDGESSGASAGKKGKGLLKWFAIGFLGSLTNLDANLFFLTAIKETFQTQIPLLPKALFASLSVLFYLLPVLLPLCLYALYPERAQKLLAPVRGFMVRYGAPFVAAVFLVFGAYLIASGFQLC
ncbi:MAG: GAP family protein [Candidatus Bilamarchaeaceae archaeon]